MVLGRRDVATACTNVGEDCNGEYWGHASWGSPSLSRGTGLGRFHCKLSFYSPQTGHIREPVDA